MTKCTLRVIRTVCNVPDTSPTNTMPATVSSLRPQYFRARLVKEVGGHESGDIEFRSPWGVISTRSGMIVITDYDNHRLQMFTEDLEHIRSVGSKGAAAGQFMYPMGITTDGHGHIFIADNGNNRIQVIDEQGNHLYMFGSKGSGPGQYRNPHGITIDTNQRLYVCDTSNKRVQVVAADGHHLSTLTQTGSGLGQLAAVPWLISSDSLNHITVSDLKGNLHIFNENGDYISTLLSSQIGGLSNPGGAVIDPWGTLLVADAEAGCVCVLGEGSQVTCRIGNKGKEQGLIARPIGITLTNRGDLIVCDCWNHKILKYKIPKSEN